MQIRSHGKGCNWNQSNLKFLQLLLQLVIACAVNLFCRQHALSPGMLPPVAAFVQKTFNHCSD